MDHCEIFIIFPVYEEFKESPFYINKIDIKETKDYEDCISRIENIIKVFKIENYEGYYDSKNIEEYLYPITIANDYYPNIRTRFRIVLKNWGENWRDSSTQSQSDEYQYFKTKIKDDSFCEIAKRKYINHFENNFLIINHNALKNNKIEIEYNNSIITIDAVSPEIKSIAEWFSNYRTPARIYNWNPKHGVKGKWAHKLSKGNNVSVLMCSNKDALNMLKFAFGETDKTLFYYDRQCNQYIEFKQEIKNTYHAFHLNERDENRIPLYIKKILNDITSK